MTEDDALRLALKALKSFTLMKVMGSPQPRGMNSQFYYGKYTREGTGMTVGGGPPHVWKAGDRIKGWGDTVLEVENGFLRYRTHCWLRASDCEPEEPSGK